MCKRVEYAKELRVGEKNRDASDKIRGFLYQDLLTIELILSAKEDDKIYVEWIEDIFIEDDNTISIYQVKYYPRSRLYLEKTYRNLFYQFLKYKLFENNETINKKEVKTYCLYYADNCVDVDKDNIMRDCIRNENDIHKIDKEDIKNKLKNCSKMEDQKNLIFERVASSTLNKEFKFDKVNKKNIEDIRNDLKETLFETNEFDKNMLQIQNDEEIKEILLSVAIQYVQESYYHKQEDYKSRCMTKASFFKYMNRIIGIDEQKYVERIKYIVLSYIDEVFSEIFCEITENKSAKLYREIYLSTKDFFVKKLDDKEQRFKFLNTISTDQYEKLNRDKYMEYTGSDEVDKFLEHKDKIRQFVKTIWKILYDIECTNFSEYLKSDESECFFFEYPDEKGNPVIVISPGSGEISREATKTYKRILKMKSKPRKWYFRGNIRGLHEYSFNVNRVNEAKINDKYSIIYREDDYFIIECMSCISYDEGQIEIKDPDFKCIFELECTKG